MFEEEIEVIANELRRRLIEKQDKHGDEWKTSTLTFLRNRIDFMYKILIKRRGTSFEPISLVDMANQCMLLYIRLIEEGGDKTTDEIIERLGV